jgi:uncharacterized tellurite resistance protein B-like protein
MMTIGEFLDRLFGIAPTDAAYDPQNEAMLAAGALMVHIASIDGAPHPSEEAMIESLLVSRFGVEPAAAARIVAVAREKDREADDLFAFATILRGRPEEERLRIIEAMQAVADADGARHEFEETMIWRAAEILGVGPAR